MAKRNRKGQFVKGGSRRRKHVRRAKARVVRSRRRRHPAVGYVVGSKRIRRRKLNPRTYRSRRRRRFGNPRFSVGGIINQLKPAAFGAAGGIALDVVLGYIPLPDMLKTGYPKHATRIVGALGVGWLAKKFLGSRGQAVAAGALTIAVYNLMKDVIVQFAPMVKGLGDYEEVVIDNRSDQFGAYLPGTPMGAYLPDGSVAPGMGAYLSEYDPAETIGGLDY